MTTEAKQMVSDDTLIPITNMTRMNQTLYAFDKTSITIPPRHSGSIPAKFLKWVTPNPKIIKINGSIYV